MTSPDLLKRIAPALLAAGALAACAAPPPPFVDHPGTPQQALNSFERFCVRTGMREGEMLEALERRGYKIAFSQSDGETVWSGRADAPRMTLDSEAGRLTCATVTLEDRAAFGARVTKYVERTFPDAERIDPGNSFRVDIDRAWKVRLDGREVRIAIGVNERRLGEGSAMLAAVLNR